MTRVEEVKQSLAKLDILIRCYEKIKGNMTPTMVAENVLLNETLAALLELQVIKKEHLAIETAWMEEHQHLFK